MLLGSKNSEKDESVKKPIRILLLDFDGFFTGGVSDRQKQAEFSLKPPGGGANRVLTIDELEKFRESSTAILLSDSKCFVDHILKTNQKYQKNIVTSFSSRQSFVVENRHTYGHSTYRHESFVALPAIAKAMKADEYDPFLMPDYEQKLRPGTTRENGLTGIVGKALTRAEEDRYDQYTLNEADHYKVLMLAVDIERYAKQFPNDDLVFEIGDDLKPILLVLSNFFKALASEISKRITIRFYPPYLAHENNNEAYISSLAMQEIKGQAATEEHSRLVSYLRETLPYIDPIVESEMYAWHSTSEGQKSTAEIREEKKALLTSKVTQEMITLSKALRARVHRYLIGKYPNLVLEINKIFYPEYPNTQKRTTVAEMIYQALQYEYNKQLPAPSKFGGVFAFFGSKADTDSNFLKKLEVSTTTKPGDCESVLKLINSYMRESKNSNRPLSKIISDLPENIKESLNQLMQLFPAKGSDRSVVPDTIMP